MVLRSSHAMISSSSAILCSLDQNDYLTSKALRRATHWKTLKKFPRCKNSTKIIQNQVTPWTLLTQIQQKQTGQLYRHFIFRVTIDALSLVSQKRYEKHEFIHAIKYYFSPVFSLTLARKYFHDFLQVGRGEPTQKGVIHLNWGMNFLNLTVHIEPTNL